MEFKKFLKNYENGKLFYEKWVSSQETVREKQNLYDLSVAADFGYPPAHCALGFALFPTDSASAIEQFILGAKKGDVTCQYKLTKIYFEGKFCAQNQEAALLWGTILLQNTKNDKIQEIVNELTEMGVKYDMKYFKSVYSAIEAYKEYEINVKEYEEEKRICLIYNEIHRKNCIRGELRKIEKSFGPLIKYAIWIDKDVYLVVYDEMRSEHSVPNHVVLFVHGNPIVLAQLPCLSQKMKEKFFESLRFMGRKLELLSEEEEVVAYMYVVFIVDDETDNYFAVYFNLKEHGIEVVFLGDKAEAILFEDDWRKKFKTKHIRASSKNVYENIDL